jgi:hypothetical protein
MTVAAEYRKYAQECLESARSAGTDDARQQYLDIAKLWLMAADRLEGGVGRLNDSWLLDGQVPQNQGVAPDGSS